MENRPTITLYAVQLVQCGLEREVYAVCISFVAVYYIPYENKFISVDGGNNKTKISISIDRKFAAQSISWFTRRWAVHSWAFALSGLSVNIYDSNWIENVHRCLSSSVVEWLRQHSAECSVHPGLNLTLNFIWNSLHSQKLCTTANTQNENRQIKHNSRSACTHTHIHTDNQSECLMFMAYGFRKMCMQWSTDCGSVSMHKYNGFTGTRTSQTATLEIIWTGAPSIWTGAPSICNQNCTQICQLLINLSYCMLPFNSPNEMNDEHTHT